MSSFAWIRSHGETFMLPDVRLSSFWYCRALHTVHFTMVNHSSINAQIGADTSC